VTDIATTHDGHLMTGILGTKALVEVLPKYGQQALLYRVATQTTYPGWGWWIRHGATTLWQNWSATGDQNHAMLGPIDEFLFNELAGIQAPTRPATDAGYQRVRIQPFLPEGLASASAKLRTVHGEVVSRWNRAPDGFQLRVTLPANTVGVVSLPATADRDMVITEGDSLVWKEGSFRPGTAGFSGAVRQKGRINFSIGSGSYVFRLQHGSGPGDNP